MQCAHQQFGRGSPELRDGEKTLPAGYCRENFLDTVETLRLGSARTLSSNALRETNAT